MSDAERLLELLGDPAFRARFALDPEGTARALGLDAVADDLAQSAAPRLESLDRRESRSSLAGMLLATAAEAVAIAEIGGHLFGAQDAQAATLPTWNASEFGAHGTGAPITPQVTDLVHHSNVSFDASGIADLDAGRIDPRVVSVLLDLSHEHKLVVSAMASDHGEYTANGSVSNHYYGRAVDIASIDGRPVDSSNEVAKAIAIKLSQLDPSIRPTEIGSPWALSGSAYFTDADHQNHLHIGFDDPITPNWRAPADEHGAAPAASASPASPAPVVSTDDTSDGNSGDDGVSSDDTSDGDSGGDSVSSDDTHDGDSGDDGVSSDDTHDGDSGDDGDSHQDDDGSDGESGGDDDSDSDSDDDSDEPGEGSNGEDANDSSDDVGSSPDDVSSSADTTDATSPASTEAGDASSSAEAADAIATADTYPGNSASQGAIAAWMAQEAEARGVPAELPAMAALVESGLANLDHGDADSVGYFQMRTSIWNSGTYAGYPDDPMLQLRWFLDEAVAVKQKRLAEGLPLDSQHYGDWIADIERPAEQYRGRYQLRLDEARELLALGAKEEPQGTNDAQVLPAVGDQGS